MSCPRKITVTPEKKFRSSLKAQSPVCIGRYAPSCVRATVFGSSGRCSSPVRAIVMCSWARHDCHSSSPHPRVYKWLPADSADLMLGGRGGGGWVALR